MLFKLKGKDHNLIKLFFIGLIIIMVILTVGDLSDNTCHYTGCDKPQASGSNWCYQHTKFAEKYGVYY